MANYTSIGSYDATAMYPQFRGLLQYGDGINYDPRYATDACNVETPGGVLQPCAECQLLAPELPHPIETLALLHRRHQEADRDLLVAASGNRLYAMVDGGTEWTLLGMPEGLAEFQSSVWSWVSYEINPEGSKAPVDVLLLSNALDGMFMVRGDDLTVSSVPSPKKFGVIARYAERIWGGAIDGDPDMLVYSAPYDPMNWEADVEHPEDGAGDILQPSWDGDSFTALSAFGSQLIAFKRTRVWRILGTDPGEYAFKEQYGGGAPYAQTIAVDAERIFMLTAQGVALYDGLSVNPFQQEYAQEVFRRMNKAALHQATACLWDKSYYCAIPLDGSTVNNAVLIFNTEDGTWLLRDDVSVESFLPTENELYFTSTHTPGRVWLWHKDSWETGEPTPNATRWVSPWNDLGHKKLIKGGFEVYFLAEVKDQPANLTFSIQTEKKTKTKHYSVTPVVDDTKSAKQKRLHFGGNGRRFRLIIESAAGEPVWRLIGGVMVVAEIDSD